MVHFYSFTVVLPSQVSTERLNIYHILEMDIRLVEGDTKNQRPLYGRVELLYEGVWGTVCANASWGQNEADLVCKQLGFLGGMAIPPYVLFIIYYI